MTFSRHQLAQRTTLDAVDLEEVHRCRRAHNQLGFAYQVGFVRLLNRFLKQESFEVLNELLLFTGVQLGVATNLIDEYRRRRQTISEHQQRITRYRGLRHFAAEERQLLVAFVFDAASRLCTTRATWSSMSSTRTPTAIPTSTSPRSRCSAGASVRGFGASRSSDSTVSTRATTAFSGALWVRRIGRSTRVGSPTSGMPRSFLRLAGVRTHHRFGRAEATCGI